MKLDIGNGKILGTKKVSQNGQISGFTDYAGEEVLVILPDGEPDVQLDTRDYLRELQAASNEHMKVAFSQYQELKQNFEGPDQATREFMENYTPRSFSNLYEKVQSFVADQVEETEKKVKEALDAEREAERQKKES